MLENLPFWSTLKNGGWRKAFDYQANHGDVQRASIYHGYHNGWKDIADNPHVQDKITAGSNEMLLRNVKYATQVFVSYARLEE